MPVQPASLVESVLEIAREAGREILAVYNSTDYAVEAKADRSPLTAADRAAHAVITRELARLTPHIPVWSEESGPISHAQRAAWSDFWLVDPLDGTREFIKRNGEFTVNIALVRDHEPVLGVVHAPALDRDYYGCRALGAFTRHGREPTRSISVRCPAPDPVRVVGSRSHRGDSLVAFLHALGPHEMIAMGSSLKFCLVAAGEADVYPRLGPTSEWDTAAAQAVVECAGGRVVDLGGRPLRYNTRAEVINPHFLVYGDAGRDWLGYAKEPERT